MALIGLYRSRYMVNLVNGSNGLSAPIRYGRCAALDMTLTPVWLVLSKAVGGPYYASLCYVFAYFDS